MTQGSGITAVVVYVDGTPYYPEGSVNQLEPLNAGDRIINYIGKQIWKFDTATSMTGVDMMGFRIWQGALQQADVTSLKNGNGLTTNMGVLVYYEFDTSGQAAGTKDLSGNGKDAVAVLGDVDTIAPTFWPSLGLTGEKSLRFGTTGGAGGTRFLTLPTLVIMLPQFTFSLSELQDGGCIFGLDASSGDKKIELRFVKDTAGTKNKMLLYVDGEGGNSGQVELFSSGGTGLVDLW
eukprot:tig00000254_g22488.t1